MPRTLLSLLLLPLLALPAEASSNSGSWTATADVPYPPGACDTSVPGSWDDHSLPVRGRGTLLLDLHEFTGDWDLAVLDARGVVIAAAGTMTLGSEVLELRLVRKERLTVRACRATGLTPEATLTWKADYR